MNRSNDIAGIPDVCEVAYVSAPGVGPDAHPELLLEVPHGATRERHFRAVRDRLVGTFPDDLIDFFFVNTDVGSPEYARQTARMLTRPGDDRELEALLGRASLDELSAFAYRRVLIVRGLIPRTFIDCNRGVEIDTEDFRQARVTPAIPEYVTVEEDIATLERLYRAYQEVAGRAYEVVCGAGGTALTLHTYAPRAVDIHELDENVVKALRQAYEPEAYAKWPKRPDVDIISEAPNGSRFAPPGLVASIVEHYARIGIEATENVSYRMHPSTMAYHYSTRYPERIVCMEISRALLADPFTPFREMRIGKAKVARMSAPIAAACLSERKKTADRLLRR